MGADYDSAMLECIVYDCDLTYKDISLKTDIWVENIAIKGVDNYFYIWSSKLDTHI